MDGAVLQSVNGTVTAERGGLGAGAGASLQSAFVEGDMQVYRGAASGRISGTANLDSTVVIGGGRAAVLGQGAAEAPTPG